MKLKPAVRVARRISEIGREAWDACAANPDYMANPFVAFDFLDALEEANCAVEHTGWGPRHQSVPDDAGKIIGRRGTTIQAIRSLVQVGAQKRGVRCTLDLVED